MSSHSKSVARAKKGIYHRNSFFHRGGFKKKQKNSYPEPRILPGGSFAKIKQGSCPNCSEKLVPKKGKFGNFYGCSSYPKCKFTAKHL
ncbi:MAG: topoisomerase DNA-binding C4 zinc finger domain-containing protein [bacterium]|nr:topoisomerase DNA-binding C4 zinc finger domain-containing protein [bacterium]